MFRSRPPNGEFEDLETERTAPEKELGRAVS